MNLLIDQVIVDLIELKLAASCGKNDILSLSFESLVERPGGNFCWQRLKERLLWVHEKATKYKLSVKLKVFHYPEQKGLLY